MVAAVAMMTLAGCSGSMNGQVGGLSLNVADAAFAILRDDQGKATSAIVVMSDKPKICEAYKSNRVAKTSTSLAFTLFRFSDTDYLSPDAAEYTTTDNTPTSAGSYAWAFFERTDSDCRASTDARGKSGLVKLTNIKGEANGSANATFDITFSTGDKVTGSFNATYCDITKLPTTTPNCE
jgi:hypothetical protein